MNALTIEKLLEILQGKEGNITLKINGNYISDEVSFEKNELILKVFKEEKEEPRVILENKLIYNFDKEQYSRLNKEYLNLLIDNLNNKIKAIGCIYGQLGHSDSLDVSLSNVSHAIKKLELKDKELYGTIEVLSPKLKNAKILRDLIIDKGPDKIEFGIRAKGIRNNDGTLDLKDIYSFDVVNVIN